jgi:hypothetical protein
MKSETLEVERELIWNAIHVREALGDDFTGEIWGYRWLSVSLYSPIMACSLLARDGIS